MLSAAGVVVLLLSGFPVLGRCFRRESGRFPRLPTTRLFSDTRATSIAESIAPTVYETDLYKVLGVNMNATRTDLRDAYWKIAYQTHPDRNNTPEALSVFRNASYAYKVLGRDEKTRAEYDAKYRALIYIDVVEQLGRDVFKPLAMEVAMPLINMTVRGIGKLAVPFFKDAVEQSTEAYRATFEGSYEEEEVSNMFDMFERAAAAAARTSMEQRIRRTKEGIDSATEKLEATSTQLWEVDDEEQTLRKSVLELQAIEAKETAVLDNVTSIAKEAKVQLEKDQQVERQWVEGYARSERSVTALLESAAALATLRTQEEEEVRRLETALLQAKERVRETIIKQTGLEISISFEKKTREGLATNLTIAAAATNVSLSAYRAVEGERLNLTTVATKLAKERQEAVYGVEKAAAAREALERRVRQLITKKANLENVLAQLKVEYAKKHARKLKTSPGPAVLAAAATSAIPEGSTAGATVESGDGSEPASPTAIEVPASPPR